MKRMILFVLAAALLIAWPMSSALAYEALGGPTEVLLHNEAKSYNGYTLFRGGNQPILIDMKGNLINIWTGGGNPKLLPTGNILASSGKGFIERDWNDNIVWSYTDNRSDYAPHHDFCRRYNPKLKAYTTMYIANKSISVADGQAAGATTVQTGAQMDAIVEVDMNGNVVWEWWFFDHVIQDKYPDRKNYVGAGKKISDYPGKIDINMPGKPLKSDWLHLNSMDYNPVLDQVTFNTVQGEFYIIDHGNTFIPGNPAASIALAKGPAGDILYRFGDPARYQQGDPPSILIDWNASTPGHKQIGGSHDIHWIMNDPDVDPVKAGNNMLVFNNGQYLFERTPQSYVFEINPYLNKSKVDTGKYVNPPDAGYTVWTDINSKNTHKQAKNISNQIVWKWYSPSNLGFFAHIASGAQRLPNGNTFIASATEGHFVEVTPDGEAVWEYISPVTTKGVVQELRNNIPMDNTTFRAYRYGPNYAGLAGRDLTPRKGTIAYPLAPYGFGLGSSGSSGGVSGGVGAGVGGAGAGY